MKKGLIALFTGMVTLMLISTAAYAAPDYDIEFRSVRFGGIYDGELEIHYNVYNPGEKDIEGANVNIWIPDLGYYEYSNNFNLDDKEKHGYFFNPVISELEPGEYFARIMVSSDYAKDSVWRWIVIE